MANYWRRFFNVDEIPEDQPGPDDNNNPEMPDDWSSLPDHAAPTSDPGPASYTASHGHLQIPLHLVQLAWMLDSVLHQVNPETHPDVVKLHQRMATGTIRDLSSLNLQELSDLGTVLAITAHRLARQADPNTPAHEVALPPMSDEGL